MSERPDRPLARRVAMGVLWVVLLGLLVWIYAVPGRTGGHDAHDAVGWGSDLTAAMAEARARGVPVLANFTAEWCPPCQLMHGEVYSDEAVGSFINERFVPVEVDMTAPGPDEQRLAAEYRVDAIPTLLILQADGQPSAATIGYVDKQGLLAWLGDAGARLEAPPVTP